MIRWRIFKYLKAQRSWCPCISWYKRFSWFRSVQVTRRGTFKSVWSAHLNISAKPHSRIPQPIPVCVPHHYFRGLKFSFQSYFVFSLKGPAILLSHPLFLFVTLFSKLNHTSSWSNNHLIISLNMIYIFNFGPNF